MGQISNIVRSLLSHPLTRDRPLAALARFAVWQVRSRLRDEVVVPWVGGQKLAVRRGMTGATGNIYLGLHEFRDMMLALHFLREDDLFIDIGANVGSYTVLAAGARRAQAWAFEPDPASANALRRNVAVNGLHDRVTVHELALGATGCEVAFTMGRDTENHVVEGPAGPTRTVPQRRLDDLVGERRPSMIKIDVEGYEDEVVDGARKTLSSSSLKVVLIETASAHVRQAFAGLGFAEYAYDPLGRTLDAPTERRSSANAIFVRDRDRDTVLERLAGAAPVTIFGRAI